MLKIKLSRRGKKKHPIYRLIISEVARDPYGNNLEILGSYDPHTKELQANADRIKHWLSHGAQMTDTVNNLLVEKKIIEGKKVAVSKLSKKTKEAIKKKEEAAKAVPAETAPAARATASSSDAEAVADKDESSVEPKEKEDETAAAPVEAAPVEPVPETSVEAPAEEKQE